VTEPGDGMGPLYALMSSAATTLDVTMYELVDVRAEQLLADDAARKVAVRVVLDRNREGAANQGAFDYLSAHGVRVRWAPPAFDADHEKSLIVDRRVGAILTLNLTSRYYPNTRDFAVVDTDPADVAALAAVFDADFAGTAITAPTGHDLMWSPGSEAQMVAFIASAASSVTVENEEMSDLAVIAELKTDARRGVDVTVTMTNSPQWTATFAALTSAGVHVRVDTGEKPLYIHAKAVVDDAGTALAKADIGSQNDTATSLGHNREVGLILTDPTAVASVSATLSRDSAQASPWKP
jgi:cardiolipin synthase A/B